MLNEEKVRDMTVLAIFEKNEGRKIFPINCYFKSDYVGGKMFRAFFGYSFCYLLILALWVLCRLDDILAGIDTTLMLTWGKIACFLYAGGLLVYLIITALVYSRRYDYASRSQLMFASKLKHLVTKYGRSQGERTRNNRGGRER